MRYLIRSIDRNPDIVNPECPSDREHALSAVGYAMKIYHTRFHDKYLPLVMEQLNIFTTYQRYESVIETKERIDDSSVIKSYRQQLKQVNVLSTLYEIKHIASPLPPSIHVNRNSLLTVLSTKKKYLTYVLKAHLIDSANVLFFQPEINKLLKVLNVAQRHSCDTLRHIHCMANGSDTKKKWIEEKVHFMQHFIHFIDDYIPNTGKQMIGHPDFKDDSSVYSNTELNSFENPSKIRKFRKYYTELYLKGIQCAEELIQHCDTRSVTTNVEQHPLMSWYKGVKVINEFEERVLWFQTVRSLFPVHDMKKHVLIAERVFSYH